MASGGDTRRAVASEGWQSVFDLFFQGEGQRRFHEACEHTGLAPGALKTLLQVDPEEPAAMRDLAEHFHCDPSYVTSLVDSLESAGLAERRLHEADRRVKVVGLTEQGIAVQRDVRKILAEPPDSFDALSLAELRQLRSLLAKIRDAAAGAC